MPITIKPGSPLPFGAVEHKDGVNFSLFSQESPELIIQNADLEIIKKIKLTNQTGQIFHVLVSGLPSTFIYSYRLQKRDLLDPFAKVLTTPAKWDDNRPYHPKALYTPITPFEWGEDKRPGIQSENLLIYEMHVRGYSKKAPISYPGTFLGIIEKIDHLKSLGINAIELMPVTEFNPYEFPLITHPLYDKILQYWGYSPVSFFAPMNRFSAKGPVLNEFKQMVKALHEAGIEVILDMVFNHTAEGNEKGFNFNFKDLSNSTYYILDENKSYANYSGCGNTLSCNHIITAKLILASLQYFVTEMHVDGFRIDLASIFYRGENGEVLKNPPILEWISQDPILANVKLIAEPWDAAGLYQVGEFYPGWSEWNAKYRDVVRGFISGKPGLKGEFATRLSGSEDLYFNSSPQTSLNFITCHDGFTLHDLVSYDFKHNLDNGEHNQDGANHNASWNCGEEGITEDPAILTLRLRQMKNLHLALILSQGIPMFSMGDEYGHTKLGNNNTWCQDNDLNWFQWDQLEQDQEFFEYYRGLIHFRNKTPLLKSRKFLNPKTVIWHGISPFEPKWDFEDHFVAFTLVDIENGEDLYAAFNASSNPVKVELPGLKEGASWKWIAGSTENSYEMPPYSSLLLQVTRL